MSKANVKIATSNILNYRPFTKTVLLWYHRHKRDLPWRDTKDPYFIWLSEVILQQTRVAQGLPYFMAFCEKYPSVHHLAAAPFEEVMRLWQGLGYYSRARNLHQTAKDISEKRQGHFPDNYKALLQLRGVGSYTAAAIASFAFGEQVAVVDGNVFRVLARYFGIEEDIGSHRGKKVFSEQANKVLSKESPGLFNQAIMEFGALQCTPKRPDCSICPLQQGCFAYRQEMIGYLPVKAKRVKVTHRAFLYFHITCGNNMVVKERGENDIWQGLYDFPLEEAEVLEDIVLEDSPIYNELQPLNPVIEFDAEKRFKHLLTHQTILSSFIKLDIPDIYRFDLERWTKRNGFLSVAENTLDKLGKPNLIVKYLKSRK